MSDLEKAAQQALDAMRLVHTDFVCNASNHHRRTDLHRNEDVCPITFRWNAAFAALEAALAQQQAEPVQAEPVMIYHGGCTIDCGNHGHHNVELLKLIAAGTKLYAGPRQAEPVALTVAQQLRQLTDKFADEWNVSDIETLSMAAYILEQAVPVAEPVVEHRIHPTDIYDFGGWLTTRPGLLEVGGSYDANPMADAIREYIRAFPDRFASPVQPEPEVAWGVDWGQNGDENCVAIIKKLPNGDIEVVAIERNPAKPQADPTEGNPSY